MTAKEAKTAALSNTDISDLLKLIKDNTLDGYLSMTVPDAYLNKTKAVKLKELGYCLTFFHNQCYISWD